MRQTKRILLIDDDFDHLLSCNLLLQKNGYKVLTMAGCEKMEELLETVAAFKPQLIFMEHDMRGICGMDLARMLKSQQEFSPIPIIYFSGRQDIVQLASQAGANDYFRKPYEIDGLIAIASKYLPQ